MPSKIFKAGKGTPAPALPEALLVLGEMLMEDRLM